MRECVVSSGPELDTRDTTTLTDLPPSPPSLPSPVPVSPSHLQIEVDSARRVYVAVVTAKYPTRYVFNSSSGTSASPRLMAEFRDFVGVNAPGAGAGSGASGAGAATPNPDAKALRRVVEPFLKTLATKFDDLEAIDKLAAAARKVQDVQRIMADNLNHVVSERDSLLSGLHSKSDHLNDSAKKMFKSSSQLKRKALCSLWWCRILVVLFVLGAGAAIVLGLNYGEYHWW
jgi:hypothetical protein